jgi:hypothetical protein
MELVEGKTPEVQWEIRGGNIAHLWDEEEHVYFLLPTSCHVGHNEKGAAFLCIGSDFCLTSGFAEAYLKMMAGLPNMEQVRAMQMQQMAMQQGRIQVPAGLQIPPA